MFTTGGTYARHVPFTLSHPAAVIPLRRLGLPMSALVIGSMVLDVPLYLGSRAGYNVTHSALGIPTVDVLLTLAALWLWFAAVRDAMADLAPDAVRSRVAPSARLTARQWALAPVAAVIAAAIHVFWDLFTHADRWGGRHVDWLQSDHLGLAGIKWAQYVSGVVGLLVVGWAVVAHLRPLPSEVRPRRALPPAVLVVAFGVAALVALASAVAKIPAGLQSMAFHAVVNGLIVLVVGLACIVAMWHLAVRQRTG
jgi:hypothetical protein